MTRSDSSGIGRLEAPAYKRPMTWEQPTITEIKMDAEFTAYCDDLDAEAVDGTTAPEPACESAS